MASNSGRPTVSGRQSSSAASASARPARLSAAICAAMSAAKESLTASIENLSIRPPRSLLRSRLTVPDLELVDAGLELLRKVRELAREHERLVGAALRARRDLRDLLHDGGDAHGPVDLALRDGADVG